MKKFLEDLIVFFQLNGGTVTNINISVSSSYYRGDLKSIAYNIEGTITVTITDSRVLDIEYVLPESTCKLYLALTSYEWGEFAEAEFRFSGDFLEI